MDTLHISPVGDFKNIDCTAMDAIFAPKSVAVIGATEKNGSVGRTLFWNLLSSPFGGAVYPINPKRTNILGVRAYPSLAALPEKVDLAVICTPSHTVPGLIKECVAAGIKGCIIISAGFKEMGAPGIELERQVMEEANKGGLRIIGPNCLGVMNPVLGLNATFAADIAKGGNVAFLSQSGALCTAVLDWSLSENVGFSSFVSLGSMLDIDWGDLIYYLGNDDHTKGIIIYMESIGNPRSFISAAREVSAKKPIFVIKAGRTDAAAKAAASHTGSMTGSDSVLDAAFERAGVIRINDISDLFDITNMLDKQPLPKGNRLSIVTNAGGPGVLATDALITNGGELTQISSKSLEEFNSFLPAPWSHSNPIDILGDAEAERYAKSLEIAMRDENGDGALVILTPQAMTDATATANLMKQYATSTGKPVIASWMGGKSVAEGASILSNNSIPSFAFPDTAAKVFDYLCKYNQNIENLYITPKASPTLDDAPDHARAKDIIMKAAKEGRTILTEAESKDLLDSYGIPVVPTKIATSEDEAAALADKIGYPVVVKLHSNTITHKTDVGGVILNLRDNAAVKAAFTQIEKSVAEKAKAEDFNGVTVQPMLNLSEGYEIIVGASPDGQFGPVILFGMGGQLVEVFKDSALALPPLTTSSAREMMKKTKIYKALQGVRGRKSVDLDMLEKILVRFAQLMTEHPLIAESDINPLFASADRLLALDGRFVLHAKDVDLSKVTEPAIRPYPLQYVAKVTLKDGFNATIRPARPDDEPLFVKFNETLSDHCVYHHFGQHLDMSQRNEHLRLARLCAADYSERIVLVAQTNDGQLAGVGVLHKVKFSQNAICSIVVHNSYSGKGLGTELMSRVVNMAREEKVKLLQASIIKDNAQMRSICEKANFKLKDESELYANYELSL